MIDKAQKSLWDLESDVFTDYEGTISEATFKFNEFGGQFSITLDEIDGRDNPTWENYKLPPGWESADGGETISRISGDGKGITKGSQYGRFLAAVAGLDGALDVLGEDAPVNANAWIGCRFAFEVTDAGKGGKEYSFENDKGEKVAGKTKDKNYPVAFLGKDSSAGSAGSASTNGQGATDSLSVLTSLNNPVIESQIADLAKTLPFKDWFKQGYELLAGVGVTPSTHPDLITAMGGTELYKGLGGKG